MLSRIRKNELGRKPDRIPPPTPPAGGPEAEAGRKNFPRQTYCPARAALVFRVLRKMSSDFFKQTPPFQICRRSCLGASRPGIGFRQENPGGF